MDNYLQNNKSFLFLYNDSIIVFLMRQSRGISMEKEYKYYLKIALLGVGFLSITFYFLHVILGTINYPGYDFLTQAVSDLTADGSPSKEIARTFSTLYGIFSSFLAIGLIYTFRNENYKLLKWGIYMISLMYIVSAIGYGLFPLSSSHDVVGFQDIMHIVVTILVVLLTIGSLIILMIAFKKIKERTYFLLTLITFLLLMIGSISTGLVPPSIFGLAERLSVFSVVIYIGVISIFNYTYQEKRK